MGGVENVGSLGIPCKYPNFLNTSICGYLSRDPQASHLEYHQISSQGYV